MSTSSEQRVTLAGSQRVVAAGATARDVLGEAGNAIAVRVNGEPRDLDHALRDGDVIEPIAIDSADGRAILRHSTAHVLAQAVQELFPAAKLGIGPPVA
ncbi:MAG TPA: TGS domain-containing protein, partial [Streptosporangiaceae bacterium]|nr:TGS domain-containing protein [Streptosporangiaceae bacterium]